MIIAGLATGLIAGWIMKAKTGVIIDLLPGVASAVLGGWNSSLLTGVNLVCGVNLTSINLRCWG